MLLLCLEVASLELLRVVIIAGETWVLFHSFVIIIPLSLVLEPFLFLSFSPPPPFFSLHFFFLNRDCFKSWIFDGSLPPYLSSSLCTYEPSRSLRSSNEKLLKIPKRNLRWFGKRSFSFMAPSLWNSLLATLRNVPTLSQFKSQLKTFLFAQAFL